MKTSLLILSLFALSTQALAESKKVEHITLSVDAANDEWTKTNLKVKAGDILIGKTTGKVVVGNFTGEVGPNGEGGRGGNGATQLKIGNTNVQLLGEKMTLFAEQEGQVKVKVNDTKYTDNKGSYDVDLILIPSGLIPEASQVKSVE